MGWSDVRHHYPDYTDYDPEDAAPDWRTLSTSKHTARTPKTCQACHGPISPGERYSKLVGLEEGRFVILCHHEDGAACSAMQNAVEAEQRAGWAAYHEEQAAAWNAEAEAEKTGVST